MLSQAATLFSLRRHPERTFGAVALAAVLCLSAWSAEIEEPAKAPAPFKLRPGARATTTAAMVASTRNGLGGLIIADRNRTRVLKQAQDLIARKEYVEAIRYLQNLLEHSEDQLLQPTENNGKGVFRSLKAEVQRIIGLLPEAGREIYQRNVGPAADALLKDAVEQHSSRKLAEVARLYFHTSAGYEATYRLGLAHFDNGEAMAAALLFRRLQRVPEAAKRFEPMLSVRMALSWSRAGMPAEALAVLKALHGSRQNPTLTVAGQTRHLLEATGEPTPWLAGLMKNHRDPQLAGERDWQLHRANPSRNVVLQSVTPIKTAGWRISTVVDPYFKEAQDDIETELDQQLQGILQTQRASRLRSVGHLIPSRHPLVMGDLVYVRMLESVRAFDLETGEFMLQTFVWDRAFEALVSVDGDPPLPNALNFLNQLVHQRTWEDGTFGRMSSDGERLYCVEDTGLWTSIPTGTSRAGVPVSAANRMAAYDLATGKILWEVGGPPGELPDHALAGRFFLGPPLPLASQLYCLVDVNNEVQLNVLNPATGLLEWAQPLASALGSPITNDRSRRTSGLSAAYGDGILVCPTDTGATVALDLTTRSLLWGFPTEINNSTMNPRLRIQRRANTSSNSTALPAGWVDSIPTIHQDVVVLTPRNSSKIYCLDLLTGQPKWDHPRGDGLYVAGMAEGRVIVVGKDSLQAWNVDNEDAAWEKPLRVPAGPSGRGVIVGSRLLLPQGKQLLVVDLKQGTAVRTIPAPDGVELGNLIISQGRLISQGIDRVDVIAFPDLEGDKNGE